MAQVDIHPSANVHSRKILSPTTKPMSRLEQMQADLHRKLLLEKEDKMVKLYNENQAKAFEKVNRNNSGGMTYNSEGGLVRKFFNNRRALGDSFSLDNSMSSLDSYFLNASLNGGDLNSSINSRTIARPTKSSPIGWDKSYPLVPIARTNSGSSSGYESVSGQKKVFSVGGETKRRNPRRQSLDRNRTGADGSFMRRSKSQVITARKEEESEEDMSKFSTTSSPIRSRPSVLRENRDESRVIREQERRKLQLEMRKREQELVNKIKEQQAEIERMKQEKIREEKAQKARLMRKPLPASVRPRQPIPPPAPRKTEPPPPPTSREKPDSDRSSETSSPSLPPSPPVRKPAKPAPPRRKPVPPPKQTTSPPSSTVQSPAPSTEKKPPPRRSASNSDLPECTICGRRFAADRLEKHVSICSKTNTKKRKVFDPVKMRTQGTEQESFVVRKPKGKEVPKKKSNWRQKHESFLQAIRQAKVLQDHVAAGGKISDLPPPPPMDTSDYVQCPHCNRKFNEGVAERHIPKCQNILSNKKR